MRLNYQSYKYVYVISDSFFTIAKNNLALAIRAPPSQLCVVNRDAVMFTQGCCDVILIIMSPNPA